MALSGPLAKAVVAVALLTAPTAGFAHGYSYMSGAESYLLFGYYVAAIIIVAVIWLLTKLMDAGKWRSAVRAFMFAFFLTPGFSAGSVAPLSLWFLTTVVTGDTLGNHIGMMGFIGNILLNALLFLGVAVLIYRWQMKRVEAREVSRDAD